MLSAPPITMGSEEKPLMLSYEDCVFGYEDDEREDESDGRGDDASGSASPASGPAAARYDGPKALSRERAKSRGLLLLLLGLLGACAYLAGTGGGPPREPDGAPSGGAGEGGVGGDPSGGDDDAVLLRRSPADVGEEGDHDGVGRVPYNRFDGRDAAPGGATAQHAEESFGGGGNGGGDDAVAGIGGNGEGEGDEEVSIQEDRPHVEDVDESPPAIPKLVHLVAILPGGKALPPYWSQAVTYSRERSAAQGYETWLWTLPDADAAVREHYPPFVIEAWDRVASTGEGARMADFFRVAAVHTFGGVFLDLDMIPCRGLDELAGPERPAAASFPFTQSGSGQVSNAAFAAPAGHEVLTIALDLMASNERLATEHVLSATGPHMMALAVKMYAEAHGLESSVPSLYDKEEMPRDHSWLAEGGIRLGTFRYQGPKDPGTEMSLCHLAFASWMPDKYREPFRSKCEKETELVPSFIDANCRGTVCKKFSECGKV